MKKIEVDNNICIGCGYCFSSSEVFSQNDDGYACVKESKNNFDTISEEEKEEVLDIKEGCPVSAIKINEE